MQTAVQEDNSEGLSEEEAEGVLKTFRSIIGLMDKESDEE